MPLSYTLIFSVGSRSSYKIIRRLPPISVCRSLTGDNQLTLIWAMQDPAKNSVMCAMFSALPGTWLASVAETATGASSKMYWMIDMSCTAKSQTTLTSLWNNPRLERMPL
jgi:hypothetical protein